MAYLDSTEVIERLNSLLPEGWFPDLADAPNLEAVLAMFAAAYSNDTNGLWQLLQYAQRQSRLATATDFWLDLAAQDFFGSTIQRHTDESDTSLRRRIMMNLLAPRATRASLSCNVENLTGFTPTIIELRNTGDCGAYASINEPVWGGAVYNEMGRYGTMRMPYQLLIDVIRPLGEGIPNVNGYSMSGGGYATYPRPYGYIGALRSQDFGNGEYVELIDIVGQVTDQDIYDTITRTMPAGTTAWTAIADSAKDFSAQAGDMLDSNFYLDISGLADDTIPEAGGAIGVPLLAMSSRGQMHHGNVGLLTVLLSLTGTMRVGAATTMSGVWTLAPKLGGVLSIKVSKVPLSISIAGQAVQDVQPTVGHFVIGSAKLGLLGSILIPGQQSTAQLGTVQPFKGSPAVGQQSTATIGSLTLTGIARNITTNGLQSNTVLGALSVDTFDISIRAPSVQSTASIGTLAKSISIAPTGLASTLSLGTVIGTKTAALGGNVSSGVLGVLATGGLTVSLVGVASAARNGTIVGAVQNPITGVASTAAVGVPYHGIFLTGVTSVCQVGVPAPSAGLSLPLGTATGGAFLLGVTGTPLGQPVVAETWNLYHKGGFISLSSNLLTATQTTTQTIQSVFGAIGAVAGKFYWEVVTTSAAVANTPIGIGNINAATNSTVGSNANTIGWNGNGTVSSNGLTLSTWATYTSGSKLCFALDLANGMIYGRVTNGNWNNSASANPATNTGGVAIPAAVKTAAMAPGATLNAIADAITATFVAANWTYTAPTGFNPWVAAQQAPPPSPINLATGGATSSSLVFSWTPGGSPPSQPTSLTFSGVAADTLTLTWVASS